MFEVVKSWFQRQFSNPQVVILAMILLGMVLGMMLLGRILGVGIAAALSAYCLEGPVRRLQEKGLPRLVAVLSVLLPFLGLLLLGVIALIPLLYREVAQLFGELPSMISSGQQTLMRFQEQYPNLFNNPDLLKEAMSMLRSESSRVGHHVLSFSLGAIPGFISFLIYTVLFPMMVFFFMKDKDSILRWLSRFLPDNRRLAEVVWRDVDRQIGNYMRGKLLEILIIGTISSVVFLLMGLNYAVLLGALVGLSVLIPYVGATVVTIPIALIALFQFGWAAHSFYIILVYFAIQAFDANVVVPLLFSEVVNLHPVAIILSVLFFGGVWGFWGIFFAIPLATVVKAVVDAWPHSGKRAGHSGRAKGNKTGVRDAEAGGAPEGAEAAGEGAR